MKKLYRFLIIALSTFALFACDNDDETKEVDPWTGEPQIVNFTLFSGDVVNTYEYENHKFEIDQVTKQISNLSDSLTKEASLKSLSPGFNVRPQDYYLTIDGVRQESKYSIVDFDSPVRYTLRNPAGDSITSYQIIINQKKLSSVTGIKSLNLSGNMAGYYFHIHEDFRTDIFNDTVLISTADTVLNMQPETMSSTPINFEGFGENMKLYVGDSEIKPNVTGLDLTDSVYIKAIAEDGNTVRNYMIKLNYYEEIPWGHNFAKNGNFFDGLDKWIYTSGVQKETSSQAINSPSIRMTGISNYRRMYQRVAVIPGQTYMFSFIGRIQEQAVNEGQADPMGTLNGYLLVDYNENDEEHQPLKHYEITSNMNTPKEEYITIPEDVFELTILFDKEEGIAVIDDVQLVLVEEVP